jgi:hypothetical protein
MSTSFATDLSWFVFDTHTSETIKTGFKDKARAIAWIVRERINGNPRA